MNIKKKFINNAYYDVYEEGKLPINGDYSQCAIIDKDGVVLPVCKKHNKGPGYYRTGFRLPTGEEGFFRVDPTEEEIESTYNSKDNFIDFSKASSLVDYMIATDKERSLTESIISNVENEYRPNIKESDDPFMKLVKTAVQEKHFDISKYRHIFGSNFNNDKRSLESKSITLNKAVEILSKLDIEIVVTLRNRGDNVPNPMRNTVTGVINGMQDFTITYNNEPDDISTYCTEPVKKTTYIDDNDNDDDNEWEE